jgi:hypothetical protein
MGLLSGVVRYDPDSAEWKMSVSVTVSTFPPRTALSDTVKWCDGIG